MHSLPMYSCVRSGYLLYGVSAMCVYVPVHVLTVNFPFVKSVIITR